jgi:hypothetical protein
MTEYIHHISTYIIVQYSSVFQLVCNTLGHAVAQWLRHCATTRKVTGSIPDGVTWFFHWHNPSGRTAVRRQSNNVWQLFYDRFLNRPLLTVSRSFMNVANRVLWRMAIILKANKVNLFVSSVLFVFWYHSPNVLDTPHICDISWLRVKQTSWEDGQNKRWQRSQRIRH